MKITCGNCQTSYNVADEKVPARGARVGCPNCGHDILLPPGRAGGDSSSNLIDSSGVDYGQTLSYDFQEIDQSRSEVAGLLREVSQEEPHLQEGKRYFMTALPDGEVFPVSRPVVSLGRSGTDIVLNDSEVSRKHCQVKIFDAYLFLMDLQSTNGTFVGGKKVLTARLNFGETFTIGNTTLAVNRED